MCRGDMPTKTAVCQPLERSGELGVEHGMLGILVPEIVLDSAGVLAVIGEFEAGGMPEHVWMDRHAQLGHVARTSEQLTESGGAHPRAALGYGDRGDFRIIAQHLA